MKRQASCEASVCVWGSVGEWGECEVTPHRSPKNFKGVDQLGLDKGTM